MTRMAETENGASPVRAKPGRHREATLYRALAGAGAGDGRTLTELREAALRAYEATELPVWRRSGFWTTSLESLDLDVLRPSVDETAVPDVVSRTIPDRPRAGRIVQSGGAIVELELDPMLAERGVVLCSLERAFEEHGELASRWYSRRLPIDRHKLEAANAAFWTGGAFLYVPAGVSIEDPFEIVYAIDRPGLAQYGRSLVVGGPNSDFRVHEYDLAEDFEGAGAPRRSVRAVSPGRRTLPAGPGAGLGRGGGLRRLDSLRRGRAATPIAIGFPRSSAGTSCASTSSSAISEPGGDMAFRGVFFAEETSTSTCSPRTSTRRGPPAGTSTGGAPASGESRASFEGLIQIDPGAQQTHTYLQIHTMMLSPKARIDAIPSVLVSSDDVSASHGGTVGELDEAAIFYMQTPRARAGRPPCG